MTALITLWLDDKMADDLASQLNVNWTIIDPRVVTSGVSKGSGYIHSPDPAMGMVINGDPDDVISFQSICSLILFDAENAALGYSGLSDKAIVTIFSSLIHQYAPSYDL